MARDANFDVAGHDGSGIAHLPARGGRWPRMGADDIRTGGPRATMACVVAAPLSVCGFELPAAGPCLQITENV